MRKLYYILIMILLGSCAKQKNTVEWTNSQELVDYSFATFELKATPNNSISKVFIYTAIQSTELKVQQQGKKILATIPKDKNIFSGPAHLVIVDKNEKATCLPFIGEKSTTTETKDFRSPKTLITDSSLTQQQILYTVGESRNLIFKENAPAIESWKELAPQQKTYQAQKDKAVSSYYVEAGSAKNIVLLGAKTSNGMTYSTKTLKDAYGNLIAEGTKGTFIIEKNSRMLRIETECHDAKLKLVFPKHIEAPYTIVVSIGLVSSNKIYTNS